MREYGVSVLVIFSVLLVSLVFLLKFGISFVTYISIVVIIISIFGSLGYTYWKTKTDRTVDKFKNEILNNIKIDFLKYEEDFKRAEEIINMEPIFKDIDYLRNHFIRLNYFDSNFERVPEAIKKYTLTSMEQESRRFYQRIRNLEGMAIASYNAKLDEYFGNYRTMLKGLKEAGFKIDDEVARFESLINSPTNGLRELIDKKNRADDYIIEIVKGSSREMQELSELALKVDPEVNLKTEINDFSKTELEKIIGELINRRIIASSILENSFTEKKKNLTQSLEILRRLLEQSDLNIDLLENVGLLIEKLNGIDDPGRTKDLLAVESEYKTVYLALIKDFSRKIDDLNNKISKYSAKFKLEEEKNIQELIEKIYQVTDQEGFSSSCHHALESILNQYKKGLTVIKVIESYPKVEPIIENILEEKGAVSKDDLDLKHGDLFIQFYHDTHPDMELTDNPVTIRRK